jgi:NHS family xanthosine MFS transporter
LGTIGFIAAMWITNLTGIKDAYQFYIAGLFALSLCFTLPKCKPERLSENASLMETLGLESFKFFADYKMAFIFFYFLRGVAIDKRVRRCILDELNISKYADSFVVEYST